LTDQIGSNSRSRLGAARNSSIIRREANLEMLSLEIGELGEAGFDLSLTGFGAVGALNKFNRRKQSMARGGARPGAGRPAGKSANTSPPSARARARARVGDGNQRPCGLIAGHARVLAARQLGIAKIPMMVAAGWSEAQKRAYVLADNQLAITGSGWDPELLRLELGELKLDGFDLSLTGFGDLELKDIMADRTEGLTDPDDAPPVPEHPVSQTGDLWLLGRHRLLCGDSTVATDVERVLGGVEPHLMVTDPPYGVEYDASWRNNGATINRRRANGTPGTIGGRAIGKVLNDDRCDWREAWALFPGDVAYVWHGAWHVGEVQASLEHVGFGVRAHLIWAKSQMVLARGHYHFQHEPCWYAVRKGKPRIGRATGRRPRYGRSTRI
jgi:hypothetical protein